MSTTGRIDVHQHVVPPEYARWLRSKGVADAAGRELPDWEVGAALELMDRHNIRTAILSVSTPGTTPGEPAEAAEMARAVNEFSAALVRGVSRSVRVLRHSAATGRGTRDRRGTIRAGSPAGRWRDAARQQPGHIPRQSRARSADGGARRKERRCVRSSGERSPGRRSTASRRLQRTFSLIRAGPRSTSSATRSSGASRGSASSCRMQAASCRTPRIAWRLAIAGETGRGLNDILEDFRSFYFDIALSGSPAALP